MTRRTLIKRILGLGWTALGMGLCPSAARPWPSHGENQPAPADLSLREIAHKKLHHGKGRYKNPFNAAGQRSLWQILRWKLLEENRFKALYRQERLVPVDLDWESARSSHGLSITFIKHAGVMIKDLDRYILVDPIFYDLWWFIKDFSPLTSKMGDMPSPDHLLITHGHYDHLDTASLRILDRDTHVITPLGYDRIFQELGMNRRSRMDWFDTFTQGGMRITLLPSNHWTMRNPLIGANRSLWGSYLIETVAGPTIFVSGDTGYFRGFRDIGEEFSIDLAIFNLGAYEPRWFMAPSHMNPGETVRAFRELGARHLLIVHWGTFRLGDEPVFLPPVQLREELAAQGLSDRLIELGHGRTIDYDPGLPGRRQREDLGSYGK